MKKDQIICSIAAAASTTKKTASGIYNNLINTVVAELTSSGRCVLPGLGTLVVKERAARNGRNPQTGGSIYIPAKKVVAFKATKQLKESINA